MNKKELSDEYRLWRTLSSSPAATLFYKENANRINSIENKIWPHRIEYPEQLLEFKDESIYIVDTTDLFRQKDSEQPQLLCSTVYIIEQFNVFKGKEGILNEDLRISVDKTELRLIEEPYPKPLLFISEYFIYSEKHNITISLLAMNLHPNSRKSYDAVFYDKETAYKYSDAITKHFLQMDNTISLISNFINRQ